MSVKDDRLTAKSALRRRLYDMTGGKCWYCGGPLLDKQGLDGNSDIRQMHIDHVIPMAEGGPTEEWNLVPACRRCNTTKHKHSEEYLRDRLRWREAGCRPFTPEQEAWLRANGIEPPYPPPYDFWYELDAWRAADEIMRRESEATRP